MQEYKLGQVENAEKPQEIAPKEAKKINEIDVEHEIVKPATKKKVVSKNE